ncbi:PREDICTED: uncharacterized protein LOC104610944 [Nelumbo nucifera]|uniref:Senescence regulator S40 n=2 Tax=Nelumbo nucifera TaxID=4432 RepID=A0A822XL87_NELNU|nr:PREDICTED: uncharacterized protein LOC104610944 [Nelumbo nucifera]DAD20473.1 TPA_asm: hypothetical protein HUJ06_021936 [Nelumbo nucifera]
MEDGYDIFNMDCSGRRSIRNEEFDEEDVWAVMKERTDIGLRVIKSKHPSSVSSPAPRRFPTASRMIPRAANNPTYEAKVHQQSAPVNIPDWSKIYRKSSKGASGSFRDGSSSLRGSHKGAFLNDDGESDDAAHDDEDDDDDDDMIPPHEWIARKLARSQISSFSVCEGAGRTLKGRDLSKVRNAVLTRTGFLE